MTTAPDPDPYLWLEEVEGERALAWVTERNAATAAGLAAQPGFDTTEAAIREVLDSDARIPDVSLVGDRLYNVWRDVDHPRGLWRRTTWESYATADPQWETVLDLDALNAAEGEDWVWHGATILRPECRLALVDLSHGGSDADVTREFDLVARRFVDPAEGGFHRPEGKGSVSWVGQDELLVTNDFGPGTTTSSGYPRQVRRWHRGTPLDQAPVVFEVGAEDLAASGWRDRTPGFERSFVSRSIDFWNDELFLLTDDDTLTRIDVPDSANAGVHRDWLLVDLREDWTPWPGGPTHPAGALLAAPLADFLAGSRDLTVLFTPTPTVSLAAAAWTRRHLALTVLDDVRSRVRVLTPPEPAAPGPWAERPVTGLPDFATVGVRAVDARERDDVWLTVTDYLTPTTLARLDLADPAARPEPLKALPAFFDAADLGVTQHVATSEDGTRVPYFLVAPTGPGPHPTLLYGYGGFEIPLVPGYSGGLGRAWLARGGAYAVANIRGGGEFGPAWHQAALREHRHLAYEDFEAVARDLVARGVTTPGGLGIQGGSNGGLLTGNMLVRSPELFGAVVIQVPLADMRRYHLLLAGASWMAEYGDPDDPEQWAWLQRYSPYHRVDAATAYPPVLITTSTRDDRVHPGHARKLAARLAEVGADVTYYENVEGGHGGAADNAQAAHMSALVQEFLRARLGPAVR